MESKKPEQKDCPHCGRCPQCGRRTEMQSWSLPDYYSWTAGRDCIPTSFEYTLIENLEKWR